MAWNFRRRVKVAPGVHVNLSKKGASTSIGPRGAKITVGRNGTYINTGIPGTGIYSRRKIGSSTHSNSNSNSKITSPKEQSRGCTIFLIPYIAFNLFFIIGWLGEFDFLYEIKYQFLIFILGNVALLLCGFIIWLISEHIKEKRNKFTYKKERKNTLKAIDTLPIRAKERDVLKAYLDCLVIAEQIDKQNQILEQLKKGTTEKEKNAIPSVEKKIEELDAELRKVQYNADKGLTDEQKQLYENFCADFETLASSDKIWFVTGSNSTGVLREETTFDVGVFDYIYSEYDIPIINIPKSSVKFYFYPQFIIRSESTTKFTIYTWDKVELQATTQNFIERENIYGMGDADMVSTNYLYENKDGSPDRRRTYNPIYVTFNYAKYVFPLFNSMTFYISNKEKARILSETYEKYRICFDKKTESNKTTNEIVKPQTYVSQVTQICDKIFDLRNQLIQDADFIEILKNNKLDTITESNNWQEVVDMLILCDLQNCYLNLVDPLKSIKDKEYIGYLYLAHLLQTGKKKDFENSLPNQFYELHEKQRSLFSKFSLQLREYIDDRLFLSSLLSDYDADIQLQYDILLYRLLSITAKADNIISEQEKYFLESLMFDIKTIDYKADENTDRTLPDKWYKLAKENYKGNSNLIHVARRIVEAQKCVVSDIESELHRDRSHIIPLLEILEQQGVIKQEGRKRIVLVANEDELFEKLNVVENTKIANEQIGDIQRPSSLQLDPLFIDVARFVVTEQEGSISQVQRKFGIGYNRAGQISDQLESMGIYGPNRGAKGHEVLVKNIEQLEEVLSRTNGNKNKSAHVRSKSTANELDLLIGLTSVKKEIQTLTNFIKIQQEREKQGLKSSSLSYHCVFTGNPGTGKTTVARIVADIYKELGVLKKGHLVETDRAGLVAEYVGQTAVKTNKIIDSALDGVLFIDEAYSMVSDSSTDYGKEAIATLLKRMEDDRDRLVVILAGYTKEMQDFINTNPGLQSRFNRYIEFPDYTADELYQIFELNLKKFDYKLTDDAKVALQRYFEQAVANKDKNFGNGRFVRNVFEKTLEHQANRLASVSNLTTEQLSEITIEDLPQT